MFSYLRGQQSTSEWSHTFYDERGDLWLAVMQKPIDGPLEVVYLVNMGESDTRMVFLGTRTWDGIWSE